MAYTQHGQQQRAKLLKLADLGEALLTALRPVVDTVPQTVTERVKSTGSGATGGFSTPYSPSWGRRRSKKGLQTSKKDFWFDGEMWKSYKVVEQKVTGTGVTFILASDGALGHNGEHLVDIHSKNESQNILEITDDEWEKLQNEMFMVIEKTVRNGLR